MKKVLNIILILMVFFLIGVKLFLSNIDYKSNYHLNEMDDFLANVEEKYHFVKDTEVIEYYGELIIKIYYAGHPDLVIDKSIYEYIEKEFSKQDLQKKMLEKSSVSPIYLKIEFIDIIGFSSHEMQIEIHSK